MSIKQAAFKDLPIIQELAEKTWPDTFSEILSQQQIRYMLVWMYGIEQLEKQWQEGHEFYIFYEESRPLGFIGIELQKNAFKIHKLYVLPNHQGKKIGKQLLEKAKTRAKEENCKTLKLNVNRYNKATDFYLKLDFKIEKEEDIDIGNGFWMNDYVMSLSI